jgi:hypothetical protein
MCLPLIGLVGAAVSAAGAIASANAQAAQSQYNASVERINAQTARYKGMTDQESIGRKYGKVEGEATSHAGAAGVDPTYGSPALVIFGEGGFGKSMDQSAAYINAESQAVAHENKAKQYDFEAKNAKTAGMFGAASSFLGGLGNVVKGGGIGSTLMVNS